MTIQKFSVMNLDQLRSYVLSHREDINAFEAYMMPTWIFSCRIIQISKRYTHHVLARHGKCD
jgi:hypothetical protein